MNEQVADVTAQVMAQLIKDSLTSLYGPISDQLTVKRGQFLEKFSTYCTYIYGKSSLVRTIYSKNKPMQLSEVYVRTRFDQGRESFTDSDIINKFAAGRRIIVKGNGGSGKTIFLKHLWLSRFMKPEGRIPILVELRRLNDLQSPDLASFCRLELQSDMSFGKGVFDKLCESGKFEFIFDGFDEVNRERRRIVEQQIIALSEKYKKCCFLVSGREDDRFASWGEFEVFSVSALSFPDVRELIEKTPFDRKVKKKFLDTLKQDFYQRHQSFLSSPLLAIMMLMTFNENAIIPSKLTEFYKSAFQTLLTWHDATKDSFERDRALSVDDFRKIFSTFCLISYYNQAFEFDEDQLRKFIEKSLKYHNNKTGIDEVKHDICESANLLHKDGLKYHFVHRSFQEYFAAECAMHVISGKAKDFLSFFARRAMDSVFAMCYEIHPELVFDAYLGERLRWVRDEGYLSGQAHSRRMKNPWLCNGVTLTCEPDEEGFICAIDARFDHSADQIEAHRIFAICLELAGDKHHYDASDMFFEFVIGAARDAGLRVSSIGAREIELVVNITIGEGTYSYKVRNNGAESLTPTETRSFKSALGKELANAQARIKPGQDVFFLKMLKLFDQIETERAAKGKSIDEILGV